MKHNEVVTEANVCWGKLEMVPLSPEVNLAADVPCSGRQVAVTFIKSAIPAIKLKRSRPHNSRHKAKLLLMQQSQAQVTKKHTFSGTSIIVTTSECL
jgi:hypothetical protein